MTRLWLIVDAHLLRSEEHTSELQSRRHLVCRLLLEKKSSDRRFGGVTRYHLHREGASTVVRRRTLLDVVHSVLAQSHVILFFLNERAPPRFLPFPLMPALPF